MELVPNAQQVSVGDELFARGGEMGALMRSLNWTDTPLGPSDRWPQSLRTAISICLHSRFPILIWWGPDLVMLYNDPYRDIIGAKHPQAMGAPGREIFPEIWEIIGPMLMGVLREGQATWSADQLLLLNRNGYVEECYFTFSYSPIYGEGGRVDGIFTAVTETTDSVLGERRLRTLRDLAVGAEARMPQEAIRIAARMLATNTADLPFTLIYSATPPGSIGGVSDAAVPLGADNAMRTLVGYSGVASQGDAEALGEDANIQRGLTRALNSGEAEPIELTTPTPTRLTLAGEQLESAVREALILPIKPAGMEQGGYALVTGISPLRALDDEYRSFLKLVAGHIATAIATATAYEQERKRAEALAELDRAKTTFFSNISHEFRTPLTLMLGPLADALAANGGLPPDIHAQLEIAQRNGQRLLRLVNNLLDFSRIEAGRMQARYERTDLAAYTAELASAFRSLIEKAGLRLVVDCPPLDDLPEPTYVDRTMWEKIVLNLLSNAFKFTFDGEIDVTLRRAENAVELTVRDTGVGVPANEVGRLFERFHRVEGVQARTYEGSGIGLALTQELVQLHGGTIYAESEEGQGATFVVRLPLGAAHLPPDRIMASAASHPLSADIASGAATYVAEAGRWLADDAPNEDLVESVLVTSPEDTEDTDDTSGAPGVDHDGARVGRASTPTATARVLIVDDNADMRDYLRRLLSERYIVETAMNGTQALEAIRRHPPDLVVSDIMMPGVDGFSLLRALRDDLRLINLPIIMLSARAGEEAVVDGLAAGADDYLIKPFSARELLSRVAARLEIAQTRQQALEHGRQLEAIFATMTDGVVLYDEHGRITQWNEALAQLFEFDAMPDYPGLAVSDRPTRLHVRDIHGRPLSGEQLPFMRAMRGEPMTDGDSEDLLVTTPSGSEKQVNISAAPLRDGEGRVIGSVAIYRDVTERRQLEARTHDALGALLAMATTITGLPAQTETIASENDGASVGADADGAIRQLVRLAQEVLAGAYTSVVMIDLDTRLMTPLAVAGLEPADEAAWWAMIPHARLETFVADDDVARIMAGEDVIVHEPRIEPPSLDQQYQGARTWLIVPAPSEGRLVALSVEARNRPAFTPQERDLARATARLAALVVERERLAYEREEAQQQAQVMRETTRRMDEFLGIASHELRTPLTSIMANVQIAERQLTRLLTDALATISASKDASALQARLDRYSVLMERTSRQLVRLDRLVGDLIDTSRIQAGRLQFHMEPCDLGAIACDAVQEQQAIWPDRAVTLDLPRHARLMIDADANRIGQVITNYLTNALKYSAERQPVATRVTVRNGFARVAVRDHGPGLAPDQQAHLWERFYRAPGVELQSGSGVGLGLGLHICKTIIERHGGEVGVESAPGDGSTFWFTLPLRAG